MTHENPLSLGTETLGRRALAFLREYRYAVFAGLLLGFLCHTYAFTNKLVNNDELKYLFTKGATTVSGRWGLDILSLILPDVSMPWFHGTLTLLLMTLSACLLLDLTGIRRPLFQGAFAGLLVTFPALTGTFGYMFTSSSYAVSFLMAVEAVRCMEKKGWLPAILGMALCIGSLSIYQAYISVIAGALVVVLIRRTLYTDTPVRRIFLRGLWYVAFLVLSLGAYWVITARIQAVTGQAMGQYAQDSIAASLSIPDRLRNCLVTLLQLVRYDHFGIVHSIPSLMGHLVCAAVAALELLVLAVPMVRRKQWSRLLMLLFLLAMLPFAANAIVLFTALESLHTLVFYGFATVYLLFLVLAQNAARREKPRSDRLRGLLLDLSLISIAVILYGNISIANRGYLNLQLAYEGNHSVSTTLITRIQSTPGYQADTPVAILGSYPVGHSFPEETDVRNLTGVGQYNVRNWNPRFFFLYYCGTDMNVLPVSQLEPIRNSPEFAAMPAYPDPGCVAFIGDVLTVKLPETSDN